MKKIEYLGPTYLVWIEEIESFRFFCMDLKDIKKKDILRIKFDIDSLIFFDSQDKQNLKYKIL